MRYGFLTDVHGDLEVLTRALESLTGTPRRPPQGGALEGCDLNFFLGDVAGSGREVEACIRRMRERGVLAVPGNHDLWDFELVGLSAESRDYLKGLPLQRDEADFTAVHSIYEVSGETMRFPYIHSEADARRAFAQFPQRLVFFGHTHLSQVHQLTAAGEVRFLRINQSSQIHLDPTSRYLVNVGAAPDCAVVYDFERQELDYVLFSRPTAPGARMGHGAWTLWRRWCNWWARHRP